METILNIKVIPKSSRNDIVIDSSGIVKVYLTTPPVEGKANTDCIKLLAKKIHTAKSNITITRGHSSRTKTIQIKDMDSQSVMELLKN